jgi:hypothetical protein
MVPLPSVRSVDERALGRSGSGLSGAGRVNLTRSVPGLSKQYITRGGDDYIRVAGLVWRWHSVEVAQRGAWW